MEFRPCIDIHNGKIKQIVGSSLKDAGNYAKENFVSVQDGAFYASFYKKRKIKGGHIILLNSPDSEFYEKTKEQALLALHTYQGGLQVGGGINDKNAMEFLQAGASHVIVTSFVFKDGKVCEENLKKIVEAVGKEHLVLDLSCRKKNGKYYIVTDRWQKYTQVELSKETLDYFAQFCDEFLVHAVDVEGKASGIEIELAGLLGEWNKIEVTYAGGIHCFDDLKKLKELGHGRVNATIGSALALFGGEMDFDEVLEFIRE